MGIYLKEDDTDTDSDPENTSGKQQAI